MSLTCWFECKRKDEICVHRVMGRYCGLKESGCIYGDLSNWVKDD